MLKFRLLVRFYLNIFYSSRQDRPQIRGMDWQLETPLARFWFGIGDEKKYDGQFGDPIMSQEVIDAINESEDLDEEVVVQYEGRGSQVPT